MQWRTAVERLAVRNALPPPRRRHSLVPHADRIQTSSTDSWRAGPSEHRAHLALGFGERGLHWRQLRQLSQAAFDSSGLGRPLLDARGLAVLRATPGQENVSQVTSCCWCYYSDIVVPVWLGVCNAIVQHCVFHVWAGLHLSRYWTPTGRPRGLARGLGKRNAPSLSPSLEGVASHEISKAARAKTDSVADAAESMAGFARGDIAKCLESHVNQIVATVVSRSHSICA